MLITKLCTCAWAYQMPKALVVQLVAAIPNGPCTQNMQNLFYHNSHHAQSVH